MKWPGIGVLSSACAVGFKRHNLGMVEVVLLRGESGGGWEPDQETKYAGHFLRYSLSMPAALKAL
jgi:hypothetical protein